MIYRNKYLQKPSLDNQSSVRKTYSNSRDSGNELRFIGYFEIDHESVENSMCVVKENVPIRVVSRIILNQNSWNFYNDKFGDQLIRENNYNNFDAH